ncbi:hypothetical protein AALA98_16605 [Lachnospiraceae bacterium 45-W7]
MAYNKAREEWKWRIWKDSEEKQVKGLGVMKMILKSSVSTIGRYLILTGNTMKNCRIQVHTQILLLIICMMGLKYLLSKCYRFLRFVAKKS